MIELRGIHGSCSLDPCSVCEPNLRGFSFMPSECGEDLGSRQRRRTTFFKSCGIYKCSSLML